MTPPPPPSSDRAARRFIIAFFSVLGAGLLFTVALNVIADPFRVFGTPRWPGINDRPPETAGFDRMTKPYEVLHRQPRTLVFGSSTAHSGFLTIADWNVGLPRPAYNYALLGASVHEERLSLEQALRETPAEVVIFVADFFAYNAHYTDNSRFLPKRLDVARRDHWLHFTLEDLGAFSLGIDSTKMSWQTVRVSHAAPAKAPTNASAPVAKPEEPIRVHFRNCERSYLEKWFPPPTRRYEFTDAAHHRDCLADFEAALRACREHGVRLYIVIPPIHARFQEALATVGAWNDYETWKRALVRRANAELAQPIDEGKIHSLELWDFSVFNERTCVPVPVAGPPLEWWHDSAHFTDDFGRELLTAMISPTPSRESSLGIRLVPASIDLETHLASIRQGLDAFRLREPSVVADVRDALGIPSPREPSASARDPFNATPAVVR